MANDIDPCYDPVQAVLQRLTGAKSAGEGKWSACCPAHDDQHPSLSVARGRDGRALVCCHRGCDTDAILKALGLRTRDLFPPKQKGRLVQAYDYRDADGQLLFQAVRYEPKDFQQRRPDSSGGWVWNLEGVARLLYRLPELLAADPAEVVFVAEGEKDCEAVASLGLVATTNPMGAGKWRLLSDDSALQGRRVVLLRDRDEAGRQHVEDVAARLYSKAAEVRIIEAPEGHHDVADWIEARDSLTAEELREQLLALVLATPAYEPAPQQEVPGRQEPIAAGAAVDEQAIRDQLVKFAYDLAKMARGQTPLPRVLGEIETRLGEITVRLDGPHEEFHRITAAELASAKYELTYLVEGVLVKDQPAGLVGPKKSLKTNIGLDLAIAISVGGKFLGYFRVPEKRRMAVVSGESGLATIQETALRICLAAGVDLAATGLIFSDTLPRFGDALNMKAFRQFLKRDAIEVVFIDPAYLCLPGDVNAANLFDVGRLLRQVSEACQDAGSTLVLAHHLKKGVADPYAPGQLEDIGWAGFQEYFRQWILINRREPYEPGTGMHRLWLSTGGSAGHGSLHGIDIYEGVHDPAGQASRVWQVEVLKGQEVVQNAEVRRLAFQDAKAEVRAQARLERHTDKLFRVLESYPSGDTMSALADQAGMNRERTKEAIETLVDAGKVVACEVAKGNRTLPGYKLACFEQADQTDQMTRTTCVSASA